MGCLVDNGGMQDVQSAIARLGANGVACRSLTGHGNVGYGRWQNLAIRRLSGRYHVVLGIDIDIDHDFRAGDAKVLTRRRLARSLCRHVNNWPGCCWTPPRSSHCGLWRALGALIGALEVDPGLGWQLLHCIDVGLDMDHRLV